MTPRAGDGIVLAGGRSSRFGRDKLVEPIDGAPLLWRPIRALAAAGCVHVLVVVGPDGAEPSLPPELRSIVQLARDSEPFGGPLVGLRAGLAASEAPRVVVAAGDQPALRPELLRLLASTAAAAAAPAAVVLVDPAGIRRPLPCALDRRLALAAAEELLATGERRLRTMLERLVSVVLEEPTWRVADPDANWTLDIDAPADLPTGASRRERHPHGPARPR
jgi:molybdopterin-guanine dinucleotide biosynthesis protein A